MKNFALRPIRIHCWGGLGSQLFALSLISDLLERFPGRRIVLIQHSGGVTMRDSEINLFLPNRVEIQHLNDFNSLEAKNLESPSRILLTSRKLLQLLLIKSGFLATSNTDMEYTRILPWVLTIRGHYAYRTASQIFLKNLLTSLSYKPKQKGEDRYIISLHYRLGDLLSLLEKNPITGYRVVSEINRVSAKQTFPVLKVFSDSTSEAKKLLEENGLGVEAIYNSPSTVGVIQECLDSDYFIGTSSKVSFWIITLRNYLMAANSNSLPKGNEINIHPMLGKASKDLVVNYY